MNIDPTTIILILIISSIFQAIIVFVYASKYPGIYHFGVGCSLFALGFLFVMLQGVISYPLITVVIGDSLLLLALIFQYLGLVRFLNLTENKVIPLASYILCLLLISYFQFSYNSIACRSLTVYFFFAVLSFLIATSLHKNKLAALTRQVHFLFLLFWEGGILAMFGAAFSLYSISILNVYSAITLQVFSFIGAFIFNFIVTFTFISMLNKRLSSDIEDVKEQFQQIFNLSPNASLITTLPDGKIINFNIGFLNFSGYDRTEVLNKSLMELNIYENPADRERLIKVISDNQSVDDFEVNFRHKNNSIRICSVSAKIITLNNVPYILSIINDITDRKKSEEEVLYLSYHDQLTGLYNRRFYEEELLRLDTSRNLPIAIVMADVNGLKLINDAYGHQMGDKILKTFAEILKKECRHDEITARVGGDEFVILLSKTDQKNVEKIIKRLNETISSVRIDHMILSVSMGFAIKQDPIDDLNDVFKRAEDAMYQHKLSISPSVKKATIDLIVNSIYEKNHQEVIHSKNVSEYCAALGRELGFASESINQIKIAGLRHDIGEIAIDNAILTKTEKLTEEEWVEIKRHPEIGYHILRSVNELAEIAKFVLEHHERWDGQGYPRGLKEDEITLQGRIIAVADAYCTMISKRPFRQAFTAAEAINELKRCSGTQFDESIAKLFVEKVLTKAWPES